MPRRFPKLRRPPDQPDARAAGYAAAATAKRETQAAEAAAPPASRLEKPITLLRVEPRPSRHRGFNQINAPHFGCLLKTPFGIGYSKNKNCKYPQRVRSRGPPAFF
jgi:hypothetical protein